MSVSALNPLVVVRRDRHKAVSGGEQPKTLCLSLGERHLLEESVGIKSAQSLNSLFSALS